jgi:hypothetical protein
MSLITLYNSLKNDSRELVFSKETFLNLVSDLDEKGQEMFYVIIKLHQLETKRESLDQLPYEAKFVSSKLRFDYEKIPHELRTVLFKFMEMHISSMEDEKNRNNLFTNK